MIASHPVMRVIRFPWRILFDWLDSIRVSHHFYPLVLKIIPSDTNVQDRFFTYSMLNFDLEAEILKSIKASSSKSNSSDPSAKIIQRNKLNSILANAGGLQHLFEKCEDTHIKAFLASQAHRLAKEYSKTSNKQVIFDFYDIIDVECLTSDDLKQTISHGTPTICSFNYPKLIQEKTPSTIERVRISESKIYELSEVKIIGGMQVLKHNKHILYESAAHPKYGIVAGVWPFAKPGSTDGKKSFIKFEYRKEQDIDTAIMLGGRSSFNLFHWLIEYMPRLYSIHQEKTLHKIPLLIPTPLPPQLYEILDLLNIYDAPILKMNSDVIYNVKNLFVPKLHSNIVDDLEIKFWKSAGYSKKHLGYVRKLILDKIKLQDYKSESNNKIFISRKGGRSRSLTNLKEIERLFVKKGFKVIFPEDLTFSEQVNIFHEADIIAGPGGAAFANLIFCKPETKIILMTSEVFKNFSLFSNLSIVSGVKFVALTGPNDEPKDSFSSYLHYAVSDYSVDIDKAQYVLDNIEDIFQDAGKTFEVCGL